MAKKLDHKNKNEGADTIKLAPLPNEREALQALLESRGIDPSRFELLSVQGKNGGKGLKIEMSITLPEEDAERFIRDSTIKKFDPDNEPIGSKPVRKLVSIQEVSEPEPPVKLWTGKEHGKRSKPKSDRPDFP